MCAEKLTSRLIKASALLTDTKLLLASWDKTEGIQENLAHAREDNIFGKASRSRVEDILAIFRQRYFEDPEVGRALVALVQGNAPASWLDPLLYYYSAHNDATLRAIVLEVLYPRRMSGYTSIYVDQVIRAIRQWIAEGRTTTDWSDKTTARVARHALAALRDFGMLSGSVNKSIGSIYLPIASFSFIAMDLKRRSGSGERVRGSEDWKLFFLSTEAIERYLVEAHQERLLSYHAAGSTVRMEFPAKTLEEYSHVLLERTRAQA
jgi:hypothetical protein